MRRVGLSAPITRGSAHAITTSSCSDRPDVVSTPDDDSLDEKSASSRRNMSECWIGSPSSFKSTLSRPVSRAARKTPTSSDLDMFNHLQLASRDELPAVIVQAQHSEAG